MTPARSIARGVLRGSLGAVLVVLMATVAYADTVRVIVDRALIWSTPTGVAIVLTQVRKDTLLTGARRVGDWYEVDLPPASSGSLSGSNARVGYVRAVQVKVETVGPVNRPAAASGQRPATAARVPVAPPREFPGFFNLGVGYGRGDTDLTRHLVAFEDNYAEAGSIDANYGKSPGWVFDAVGGERVWRQLSVGVGVSYSRHSQAVAVVAKVPHPFFFQTLRETTFTTEPLLHSEVAIHIPVLWTIPLSPATRITPFGGPSLFRVTQDFVTAVSLNEQYPYDQVTITGASHEQRRKNAWGFHVGVDVAHFFSPTTGVGGMVRYSRAELDFAGDANATTSGRAGGFQATGGLRLRF